MIFTTLTTLIRNMPEESLSIQLQKREFGNNRIKEEQKKTE
jgi:hypothetical protein